MTSREPIAIVGIGCRFPGGADSPESFWRALREGVDAIREMPPERFSLEALYDPRPATPGRFMTRFGGFLDGVDRFDAAFFHMSPREAERLDPQQRLLLETTWEALEAAGTAPSALRGRTTGVFVGLWLNEYEARMFRDPDLIDFYMTTGTGRYSASGRLSHFFGWNGPSVTVDCACSSSLVAVHLACQSLRAGECDLAVAAGANVILEPSITIAYSQSRMMAPDGRCKFGDAKGDGYVRSDGAGVVLLKRLADAVAAEDPIEAVILGSAVNNDGDTSGSFGTPGRAGQEDLLRKAYRAAEVDPSQVWYAEAHGTGTRAGDPVEIQALAAVLGGNRSPERPLIVGSVKTNIGHTEGAAGIAGLIKASLAVKHGFIPRSLHLQTPNPDIPWDALAVRVCREDERWTGSGPRVAGVSSFGIAGTNAHIVLRDPPPVVAAPKGDAQWPHVVTLSGSDSTALAALARSWVEADKDGFADATLADLAYGASVRRGHLDERMALVASDRGQLRDGLEAFLAGEKRRGLASGTRLAQGADRVVFVFPGQGSQWLGMGLQLFDGEPAFRESLVASDEAIRSVAGWSILAELRVDAARSRFDDISVVQPLLFAMQVAIAALWRAWGVVPSAIVGHSMGEVAAAHVAGAIGLPDAARIICRRSELMKTVSGRGAMAVVELPFAEASKAILDQAGRLSVAVSNSSRSSVVSGDVDAVDVFVARAEAQGIFAKRVKVDVASHSPHMEPLMAALAGTLRDVQPRSAQIPLYSTVTAGRVDGSELDGSYWVRNLREPVMFSTVIALLARDGHGQFVESSPHPVLVAPMQQELEALNLPAAATGSLVRDEDERSSLLEALGTLHVRGYPVDWRLQHPTGGSFVVLPRYPWQRERFWYEDGGPIVRSKDKRTDTALVAAASGQALFEVVWRETPSIKALGRGGTWLLLPDRGGVAEELEARLTAQGCGAVRVQGGRVERARAQGDDVIGVVDLRPLDIRDGDASIVESTTRGLLDLIGLAASDLGAITERALRLFVVTAGTQAVGSLSDARRPAAALFWGVGRVIATEYPGLRCVNVDVPGILAAEDIEALASEIAASSGETTENQVALRMGRRFVPRLALHSDAAVESNLRTLWREERPNAGSAYRATVRGPGQPKPLAFRELRRDPPGAGQIEIEGVACGLNFLSALSAAGACPGYPRGIGPLGGDYVGRVSAVGEGVVEHTVGDRVMALALDSFASHVRVDGRLAVAIPSGLEFESAATAPIAFVTALYALDELGRLQSDETVLIHAATGGVGLAAIQIARARSARVLGSAGSDAKREFLRSAGIDTVVDSRSLDFGDAVLAATGGRGVDVVLNSLAGDFVERGLAVLAPGGRFLELGKRDIHEGRSLDLSGLRGGASFIAVDLDGLIRDRPARAGALLARVAGHLGRGELRPLPYETFPALEADAALRKMAQAAHIGKLVLRVDAPPGTIEAPGPDMRRLASGAVLVTGGTGALGLVAARWLVEAGVLHVTLVSRRAPSEEANAAIAELRAAGATVTVRTADVSVRGDVEELLRAIDAQGPPLVGVVHAAGVLDDATLSTLQEEQLRRVLAGKAAGAAHLHELTKERRLELFLLYSSVAPLIGSAGQGSYAAANAFLDSLAAYRRGLGLAATSVAWGPWSDRGLAAVDENRGARLAERGLPGIDARLGHDLLDTISREAPAYAVAMRVDWQLFAKSFREAATWPVFEIVVGRAPGESGEAASLRMAVLQAKPGRERHSAMEEQLKAVVARVLRQSAARIDVSKSFRALGLDSLMGLELRGQIERGFGAPIPATLIWNFPTVQGLASEVARRAEISLDDAPASASGSGSEGGSLEGVLAHLESLSEEDAQRLLEEVEKQS